MKHNDQEASLLRMADMRHKQRERLAYIDFKLYFLGELRRQDLLDRFEIGLAGATRDITEYKTMAPQNLDFDGTAKLYRPTEAFKPLFAHSPRQVFMALSSGIGQGLDHEPMPMLRSEYPKSLNIPDVSVIAPITRAINQGKAVQLRYTSINSGHSIKKLAPFALVDIGARWQVRAFDLEKLQYRDYVLTRMCDPEVIVEKNYDQATVLEGDFLWNRVIELELVPHPNHPKPKIVEMDYGMTNAVLRVKVRAAYAGYMLRTWCVDCSKDHHIKDVDFALWLRDPLQLYGAEADLAPGYEDPRPGHHNLIRAM
ncbi:MAG: WYL domain-containing protein [Alcaligenaceae bacterium]|nr:WYL domain-containing protein [Ramlibacter sp. H39-3-26]MDF1484171.1 WYL domain-containing protein [Ramlibacter sp. H39-3-26]RYH69206.1 MAG: WYL domain-containing protein [Alcaligenaceae bacterium]